MSERVEIIEENVETIVGNATSNARRAVNVSLGAAAVVRENVTRLVEETGTYTNDLADKGQQVAQKRREAFNEFVEPYQNRVNSFGDEVEARFNRATESLLTRFNIPTAESIEALNKKIASLSRKVDKLAKAK